MYTYNNLYVFPTENVLKRTETVMFNVNKFVRLKMIYKGLPLPFFTHISSKQIRFHSHA